MRSMRPANSRSPKPSTRKFSAWPIFTWPMAAGGTDASSCRRERSTMLTTLASSATRSPGCASRCDTMPENGATRTASPSAFCTITSSASAERSFAAATSKLLWMLSNALCEMNDLSSSAFCWPRFFSAHTNCALAASTSAWRAATLAWTSVRSILASTWPCFTLSPSRTVTATSSPATLAFTVASVSGASEPVSGSVCSSERGSTM